MVLQTVIRNNYVYTIINQHRRRPDSIRINDDRASPSPRQQYVFVADRRGIAIHVNSH